jgi:hypothetical protein
MESGGTEGKAFERQAPALPLHSVHGTRRKIEINDSINDSFLSHLGLKLPINDSNNVFGFESFSMSCLCHLSRLLTRG